MRDHKVGNYSLGKATAYAEHIGGQLPSIHEITTVHELGDPNTVYWLRESPDFIKGYQFVCVDGIRQLIKKSEFASIIIL